MAKKSLPRYYKRYYWMIAVCNNKTHPDYHRNGARGLQCFWNTGEYWEFENWLTSTIGDQPTAEHCLGRIDKDGDFAPGNLHWELPKLRANHYRRNKMLTYQGQTMSQALWAEKLNIPYHTFRRRIAEGLTLEEINNEFND